MNFKKLFDVGQNFEDYVSIATKEEKERIPKNYKRIELSEELLEKVKSIDEKINILASGEMWCPDCQLNITVVKKLTELNENIKLSIISMGRGRRFITELLDVKKEDFKVPTMVILNKDYHIKGMFVEKPQKAKELSGSYEDKIFYLKGNLLQDVMVELVDIIKS